MRRYSFLCANTYSSNEDRANYMVTEILNQPLFIVMEEVENNPFTHFVIYGLPEKSKLSNEFSFQNKEFVDQYDPNYWYLSTNTLKSKGFSYFEMIWEKYYSGLEGIGNFAPNQCAIELSLDKQNILRLIFDILHEEKSFRVILNNNKINSHVLNISIDSIFIADKILESISVGETKITFEYLNQIFDESDFLCDDIIIRNSCDIINAFSISMCESYIDAPQILLEIDSGNINSLSNEIQVELITGIHGKLKVLMDDYYEDEYDDL